MSDGATVTALFERSDGRIVARAWNGSWRDLGILAAEGASSADLALLDGVPYAAFVLGGSVHVAPVPEPAGDETGWAALFVLAAVGQLRGGRS